MNLDFLRPLFNAPGGKSSWLGNLIFGPQQAVKGATVQKAEAAPRPTVTQQYNKPAPANLPTFNENTPLYSNVSTESAKPVINDILSKYAQQSGYTSPLSDHVNTLASVSGQYGIDPRILILASFAESGGLKPGARGVSYNNPWSTMEPGTQNLHQYPDLDTAIRYYAAGIGGPLDQPAGGGRGRYTNFRSLGPQSTLSDYIHTQNPSDNPKHELQVMLALAQQLGL